jgi:chemotaxis protein methyltransferase CheR
MRLEDFIKLRDYVYRKSGVYFDENKLYYVEKRVEARMKATGHDDFRTYFAWMRFDTSGREFQELMNLLTVNETYFFREYHQLKCFAEEVIPEILGNKNGAAPRRLRVWSAGCSTGEEAYTLAIILKEMTGDSVPWEVYATDINTEVLELAKVGVYERRAVREVPEVYLARYFQPVGEQFKVVPELRHRVKFYHLNLLDRDGMRAMKDFDAIFCRNVLIYFDDASRREVALYFYEALRPGGYIFLGHSESMSRITPIFKLKKFREAIIYQK